ncbi:putative methyltransferase [Actinoplanes missouriensis 431]|uniref:Putative methyltransferase n=1 Tax=Actinoplanes missouriensis (strain ATCC 14538 / DSM 43046 / CBS 188.64 / JCM 3121 / NBRC 102363 / NCIMB 12654 / NRRL B-3342 / UNCC 431) TaxID=512565 RepID=I0HHU2_ACTM4|nr:putative methyltransferase [Actinoplanes missouriensis 431]
MIESLFRRGPGYVSRVRSNRQGEDLNAAATGASMTGWEFAWLDGLAVESEPSWSYPELARPLLRRSASVLDLDTGGGELLAELAPLPPHTVAVESWARNTPAAAARLSPFGVPVRTELPAGENEFDLVLSRHGRLPAPDIARLLKPGGVLLTQQVGSDDLADLNVALGAPPPHPRRWDAEVAAASLQTAGLRVTEVREEHPPVTFRDITAVVHQLRTVPWQIRDFTPERYERALARLGALIRARGEFTARAHRFLLRAERPLAV